MANKRTLKKALNAISDELLTEAVAAALYGNEQHKDNADALIGAIIKMNRDFVSRLSHPEPGMEPRKYYRDVREMFAAQAGEMIDNINNL